MIDNTSLHEDEDIQREAWKKILDITFEQDYFLEVLGEFIEKFNSNQDNE